MPPTTRSRATQAADLVLSDQANASSSDATFLTNDATWAKRKRVPNEPQSIPRFSIDLSLPPQQRYTEVCAAFKDQMLGLRELFDDVVGSMLPFVPKAVLKWICWLLLRGVYDAEETAELKGISSNTGIEVYLLVCFNVILDLLMGCTSGGALIHDEAAEDHNATRMVHFRTLDWGMPSLRHVIVQLDYKAHAEGEVIASSVTYAGFVGVLTGVRKDLSMSLNFRGVRNDPHSLLANLSYCWHMSMVLVGFRRSISSVLRGFLLPRRGASNPGAKDKTDRTSGRADYKEIVASLDLVVVTNADSEDSDSRVHASSHQITKPVSQALTDLLDDAEDRTQCAEYNYRKLLQRRERHFPTPKTRNATFVKLPSVDDIVDLVQMYPTTNECTHFAAVLDPAEGKIAWARSWQRPVSAKWIRAHMTDGR
ncbi:hypothetical protein B0A48_01017 [Cryoendolithus antarcticus]|uniref:ceramidase n=1 Tax=Cryoendolithus antarcticus TaxID=1507870 RepID=A0A1V8TS69_9PEZI|nr:hypothetical protein B0A48_01017 [Cryoendolithus antarcticus]